MISLLWAFAYVSAATGSVKNPRQGITPPTRPPAKPEVDCTDMANGIKMASTTKCDMYYICQDGVAEARTCPAGFHFNPKINFCDYIESANCQVAVFISIKVWKIFIIFKTFS